MYVVKNSSPGRSFRRPGNRPLKNVFLRSPCNKNPVSISLCIIFAMHKLYNVGAYLQLKSEGHSHCTKDAHKQVKQMKHFLGCPSILGHSFRYPDELNQGNDGQRGVGECKPNESSMLERCKQKPVSNTDITLLCP